MSSIDFNQIHTQKKQSDLNKMMVMAAAKAHGVANSTPFSSHCPICHHQNMSFFVEKFGFSLYQCHHCHQLFCNPMPSDEQLDLYYNSEMKEFENQFFEDSFENRIPIFSFRIQQMLRYLKKGTILDIGSAIGIFIEAIRREKNHPFVVHSCEPSGDACRRLRQRFKDHNIIQDWAQNLTHQESYDAVTLWDTLEHLPRPLDMAKTIYKLLRPKGFWFFSTPNTDSFEWAIAQRDHVQLLPPGHINLFNLKSIEILLESSNFELIEAHTPNGQLDTSYIMKFMSQYNDYEIQLGNFLKRELPNKSFRDDFSALISKHKKAGNIFVIAQKK